MTPEYKAHRSMIERCTDPSHRYFADYGGRGITVCDEWMSLEKFIEDMGRRPSPEHQIDRMDNNNGYSKGNCRWATRIQNQRNKRDNVFVVLNGSKITIAEAAEKTGLNYTTIHYRTGKGLTQETGLFDQPR